MPRCVGSTVLRSEHLVF